METEEETMEVAIVVVATMEVAIMAVAIMAVAIMEGVILEVAITEVVIMVEEIMDNAQLFHHRKLNLLKHCINQYRIVFALMVKVIQENGFICQSELHINVLLIFRVMGHIK
jgi:hypothetical protein